MKTLAQNSEFKFFIANFVILASFFLLFPDQGKGLGGQFNSELFRADGGYILSSNGEGLRIPRESKVSFSL